MLWDFPILFMALFDQLPGDLLALERLIVSPPLKFLELSTDQLLAGYYQGGRGASTGGTEKKRERKEPGGTSALSPSLK